MPARMLLRERYLETVVAQGLCTLQQHLRGLGEKRFTRHLADQHALHIRNSPGLVGNTAQGQASLLYHLAIEAQGSGNGHQRECIGCPVPNFQVSVVVLK